MQPEERAFAEAEHFYTTGALDRIAHRRRDPDWLARRLQLGDSFIVPVWRGKSLVRMEEPPRAALVAAGKGRELIEASSAVVLLGISDGRAYFAVDVSELEDPLTHPALCGGGELVSLRHVGPMLDAWDGGLLAYARGMIHWHRRHAYCGACGHQTHVLEAGHLRRCGSGECGTEHFPRTDPAIIVLVAGGDSCLLGRQAKWPSLWYSVLAGFVEPGESLEAAVRREVHEETGIELDGVRYHSSQPWPFPASLMIGFNAAATGTAITINRDELEDARWFSREQLRDGVAAGEIRLPPRISISRQLIEAWLTLPG